MQNHKILIDAHHLYYRFFLLQEHSGWLSCEQVQTLSLPAGSYRLQFEAGVQDDWGFTIQVDGKLALEERVAHFMHVEQRDGLECLVISGLKVTLDARYLANNGCNGVLLGSGNQDPYRDRIIMRDIYLPPQSALYFMQGNSALSSFQVALNLHGQFEYESRLEQVNGGFLAGAGSSRLVLYGFPVLIDGTAAGALQVGVNNTTHMVEAWGVQLVNLLPSEAMYSIGVAAQTCAQFQLHQDGQVSCQSIAPGFVAQADSWNGIARISLRREA